MPETRVVGRVIKPHGVRGELVVDVRTDLVELRFAAGSVLSVTPRGATTSVPMTVTAARQHTGRLLVTLEGVADRDAAEALRGALLSAGIADLPDTGDPDEFYDHQLEGLAARTPAGATIGTVREVQHGAGADLLVIDRPEGEALVPFVRAIVPEVDLAAGTLTVDAPPGLLDELPDED